MMQPHISSSHMVEDHLLQQLQLQHSPQEVSDKLVNMVMKDGKKSVAEKIVMGSLTLMGQETQEDGSKVYQPRTAWKTLLTGVSNVLPTVETRSVRLGGTNHQVPMPISTDRQLSLALKWIVKHARKRSERSMVERLAAELVSASKGQGNSIKKRDELHKMAESNRAFAHFRWS